MPAGTHSGITGVTSASGFEGQASGTYQPVWDAWFNFIQVHATPLPPHCWTLAAWLMGADVGHAVHAVLRPASSLPEPDRQPADSGVLCAAACVRGTHDHVHRQPRGGWCQLAVIPLPASKAASPIGTLQIEQQYDPAQSIFRSVQARWKVGPCCCSPVDACCLDSQHTCGDHYIRSR